MIIYFAGTEQKQYNTLADKGGVNNYLMSYYYLIKLKSSNLLSNNNKNIFLDSGAYSAMTQKKEIDLKSYIEFIKQNKKRIKTYAGLDVIGDYKMTLKNQCIMEEAGLKPLWTFHAGSKEPYGLLKDMSEKYNYIALGGTAGGRLSKSYIKNHFDKCFSIIKNNCKVHGFGMTNIEYLKRYPFYSVDSTSWLSGSLRATISLFKDGALKTYKTKDRNSADNMSIILTDNKDKKYRQRVLNDIKEILKIEKFITALWTKRGVTWDE